MQRRNFLSGCIAAATGFAATQGEQTKHELTAAQYVIVELMGHKRIAGRLSQGPIPGLLQLDIPVEGGFVTQFINPSSVYRMTITDETSVRDAAKDSDPLPTLTLELPPSQQCLEYGAFEDED